ncbi:hypothetical protein GCM10011490_17930 [Pseudoclavibacter endophyticus]|uniref:PE-PPE domain-containing protein n=1 Tax=Pseudoclavibacter endophyticus TaxID=1778590 RepID=A0A6H9WD82_9MICO|nr:hypothetical protein [Pseudoclavibacter endophyticus]KAB1648859.1 hypothetical protein F8O04_00700 [Pseudoclavibacter endophyticus]GGA67785.1 hypothetical protein GCM10011490_17930 [Pseudoclavibacter endophyticus]
MSVQVDTDAILVVAAHLEVVADELDEQLRLMAGVTWLPAESALHISLPDITAGSVAVALIVPGLTLYATQFRMLAGQFRAAVALYETAEAAAQAAVEAAAEAAEAMATWLAAQALAFLLLTPAGQSLTILFVAWAAAGISLTQGLAWFVYGTHGQHAPSLLDELVDEVNWQDVIRFVVGTAGRLPFAAIPPALQPLIDVNGAVGVAAIAYAVAVQLGVLRPGTYSVIDHVTTHANRADPAPGFRVGPSPGVTTPPTIGSLVSGIPPSSDGEAQVSVTTHGNRAGEKIHEIAITGTSNQGFGTDGQPLDNQGNVGTYAGSDAESVAAALAAIQAAGVPEGATVVLAGYSQGAMVAQAIAASGLYNVEFLSTIGTPARPIGVPDGLTVVEVEHGADPIVGLQGPRPGDHDGAVVVTTDPVLDPAEPAHQGPMGNHSLSAYQASADALATSTDPQVQAAHAELAAIFEGYEAETTQLITVERADAPPVAGTVPWAVEGVNDTVDQYGDGLVEAVTSTGDGIAGGGRA